jgi:predicted porin
LELLIVNQSSYNSTGSDSARTTTLGGNYDLKIVRLYAALADNRGTGTLNTRDYSVGFSVPLGVATKFEATYVRKSDRFNTDANANQIGAGLTYALSKTTTLYTSVARLANDANASYMVTRPGANWVTVDFGMQHYF